MARDPLKVIENRRRYNAKHREELLAKGRSPASLEKQRKRRAENPEKTAEHRRLFKLRHPDRVKAGWKAYRVANSEKIAAYYATYSVEHKAEILATDRVYRAKNRDKVEMWQERRKLKARSISAIRHNPDEVYRVVSRAVSSALPRFMRDDVINSMLLAVLEGKLLLQHVGARMKDYITGYNREYDTFKTLSLDAPMGGTDLRRIDLLEAPAPYEPEEDDEDSDLAMLRGGNSLWR